jgi:hypothetical protein
MNGLVVGTLMVLGMAQQTDTVFPAEGATSLEVESPGGSIVVTGWDRSEVRIQAEHSHRTYVDVRRRGDRITVEGDARRGPASIVDFTISVPRSMSVSLDGMYTDLNVDGVEGDVTAETLQGDVTVKGGAGDVKASATTGKVLVQGARGRVDTETAAGDIRLVDVSGEVVGESAGGSIFFENAHPRSVDVGTTGGHIRFEGVLDPEGTYYFGSYGGSVLLVVPEGTAASMSLASVHSTAMTNLGGELQRFPSGDRHQVNVNGGGAVVEIETFGGRIAVMRKGTEGTVGTAPSRGEEGWGDLGVSIQAGIQASLRQAWESSRPYGWHTRPAPDTVPATIRP